MPTTPSNDILKGVLDCIIKPEGYAEPVRALQILSGPFKGVIFSYVSFKFLEQHEKDMNSGLMPMRFETKVHQAPKDFTSGELFDQFCGDILIAWLEFIQQNDLESLLSAETKGIH